MIGTQRKTASRRSFQLDCCGAYWFGLLKEQRDLTETFAWDKNTSPNATLNAIEAISEHEDFGQQISEMFESATSRR